MLRNFSRSQLFSLREVQLLPSHSCFPPNPMRLLRHETERPTERSVVRRKGIELGFRRRSSNRSLIVTDPRIGDDGHICSFFGICFKKKKSFVCAHLLELMHVQTYLHRSSYFPSALCNENRLWEKAKCQSLLQRTVPFRLEG